MLQRFFLFLTLILSSLTCKSYDHIIFKDGMMKNVKLMMMNNEYVIFKNLNSDESEKYPLKDIYKVYIEKQGNIYINKEGKRISGETRKPNFKKYDYIYLVEGKEIEAKEIAVAEDVINYTTKAESKNPLQFWEKSESIQNSIEKTQVFMIRYKSGMTDLITPLDKEEVEEKKEENKEPVYTVVFHEVMKNDCLGKISQKYNVSFEQLVEWNDLPAKYKLTTPLPIGMQLMIYQLKK